MPFVDPTDDIAARLTDGGRNAVARSILPGEGYTFTLSGFQVGRAGYQQINPVKVEAVTPSDTALTDPVFPVSGIQPFVSIETIIAPNVVAPVCRIDPSDLDANYGLGELGIFATVLTSNTPSEVGQDFLFALAHFPLLSKTPSHTLVWRVIIAL